MSRVFAGPWAGQILADFGAAVVKVEHPNGGDDVRRMGTPALDAAGKSTSDTSSFLAMNRGKRSIALSAINPRLIYCSVTGFGQTGPYARLPGYDPVFQAMSGLLSITGVPDGEAGGGPVLVGYSVADINAGFYAALGILAALHYRDQVSGRGQHIDLALLGLPRTRPSRGRRVHARRRGIWTRGLLVRRHVADGELASFSTWCPAGTPIEPWFRAPAPARVQPRRSAA